MSTQFVIDPKWECPILGLHLLLGNVVQWPFTQRPRRPRSFSNYFSFLRLPLCQCSRQISLIMYKSVLCQQSWRIGVLVKTSVEKKYLTVIGPPYRATLLNVFLPKTKMGSSYQPLLSKQGNTVPSRSRSLPTSLVQDTLTQKTPFSTPTVDEVDDATVVDLHRVCSLIAKYVPY